MFTQKKFYKIYSKAYRHYQVSAIPLLKKCVYSFSNYLVSTVILQALVVPGDGTVNRQNVCVQGAFILVGKTVSKITK